MYRAASVVLILALFLLAACAGVSRFGAVEESLQSEIGVLSYDEAVARWGQPSTVSQGKTMFTAYWLKERSRGWVKDRLWLTFDNEKKLLRAFRYTSKPFE
ncbi:MAG: hypothetical protein C4525_16925 [Desulfarculus sp.]|jgi:hypothetical protein|nr:MAG: hypothetical protein C4525_16925 [Desulfarculus sp.]